MSRYIDYESEEFLSLTPLQQWQIKRRGGLAFSPKRKLEEDEKKEKKSSISLRIPTLPRKQGAYFLMNEKERQMIKLSGGTITALKDFIKKEIDYSEHKTLKIKYKENVPFEDFPFEKFINQQKQKKNEKKENKRKEKAKKQAQYREKLKKEGRESEIKK